MHPSRRHFLGLVGAAALTTAAAGAAAAKPGRPPHPPRPGRPHRVPPGQISVQLYSVREAIGDNPEPVLARLREIGYRKVELAGTYGLTAAAFRRMLDRNGLQATSTHIDPYGDIEAKVEDAVTLGHRYGATAFARFDNVAEWQQLAEQINIAAAAFDAAGIRYGYHNHDAEFLPLEGGVTGYDVLRRECDRRLVHLELDLYWAVVGGVDPVALFRADPRRYLQLHVKDRAEDGSFADLGTGTIDFGRIFREARTSGTVEYIVEHDQPSDPLSTVDVGYRYLRDLRY